MGTGYYTTQNPAEPATNLMLKMMQFNFLSTFYEHPIQLQAPSSVVPALCRIMSSTSDTVWSCPNTCFTSHLP